MDGSVVVPWRAGCEHRLAALVWLRPRLPLPVVLGSVDGDWCKAEAVAAGVRQVPDTDVLVVHDADVWCDGLDAAVDAVASGVAAWAVPHRRVCRLDEVSTAAVLAGGPLAGTFAQRPYLGHAGGGIVVLRRDVWESCPLDPRFVGWGQEDDSWALALRCLHGEPWRGTDDLWHLWHPPQPRASRVRGSDESWSLHRRYVRARRDRELMVALVGEARESFGRLET